jgi:diguanylate cyclase (GGDEF)-like protein
LNRGVEHTTVIEEHQKLADDTIRIVEIHSTPMRINRREFDLAIVQDVTDQRRAHQELQRLASTDDLTGALNRRRFLEVAGEELARAERYGREAALLMLDLDHFKSVNDTRGHLAGDEMLATFAKECGALMRENDRFARLGGEEFAVFLPETGLPAALALAERIRSAAERSGVTVSIGAAQWEPGSDIEVLYARADKNLYTAKQDGRNRVVG